MKKDKNAVLDDFIGQEEEKTEEKNVKTVVENDHSIIERVDKVVITKDGKQLLND